MTYSDLTVYVEDKAGDLGAPGSPAPWWLSPDVDIPSHSGEAFQGTNQVQIRIHAHEEPLLDVKIVAEVYVGNPGFVLSPGTGTKRIDPGNLVVRPPGVAGTEPVANETGATLTFPWTPSGSAADVDGPGHRCLIVRAFPETVTPPTDPFDVPNEQHEAQHNIEVLSTTMDIAHAGAGTPHDPRGRDGANGLWWEELVTMAAKRRGRHYVVWAFDPKPSDDLTDHLRRPLHAAKVDGFSDTSPGDVTTEARDTHCEQIDPRKLLNDRKFEKHAHLGKGLFGVDRLVGAATVELAPQQVQSLVARFDLSGLAPHTAVVLHGAQFDEHGQPEGGMTIVAVAPVP
jgi:hypothetical protein